MDRAAGQDYQIWIGGEKATLLGQLDDWFFDFGVNIVVGGGYYSQTSCGEIRKAVRKDRRDAILIYGGDHDPSGHDIQRDLEERTRCWTEVIRVAVGPDEVEQFDLPENPGKDTDPRADAFIAEFGELVQVEIEALDPDDLPPCTRTFSSSTGTTTPIRRCRSRRRPNGPKSCPRIPIPSRSPI